MTFPCDETLPDFLINDGGVYRTRIKDSDISFWEALG